MNSTFKVVFNKARGALMVVNEVTSSVQAKGTKTVVATAVAAMIAGVAGTAMAETDPLADLKGDIAKLEIDNGKAGTLTDAATVTGVFDIVKGGTLDGAQKLTIKAPGAQNAGTIGGTTALTEIDYLSDFTNTKDGAITADRIQVGADVTVTNTGKITTNDLVVHGQVNTAVNGKDGGYFWFKKSLTLNDKGVFNITDYLTDITTDADPSTSETTETFAEEYLKAYNTAYGIAGTSGAATELPADTIVLRDGDVMFNGGHLALNGKTEGLNLVYAADKDLVTESPANVTHHNVTVNEGTYVYNNVAVGGDAVLLIGKTPGSETDEKLSLTITNLFLNNTSGVGSNTIQNGFVTVTDTLTAKQDVQIKGLADVTVGKIVADADVTVSENAALTAEEVAVADGTTFTVAGGAVDLTTVNVKNNKSEVKPTPDAGGAFTVTGGQTTIGTLNVADQATATLGVTATKDFVKVTTLTNEGSVTVKGGDVAVDTFTNKKTVSVDANAALVVANLSNIKNASVTLASGDGSSTFDAKLTLTGESTNLGRISGASNSAKGVLNIDGSLKNGETGAVKVVEANVKGSVTNINTFEATTLNVAGTFDNTSEKIENVDHKGKITATTVNVLKGGILKTAADETNVYAVATTNVKEGATLSFAKLNTKVGSVTVENALTLTNDYNIDGTLAIGDTAFAGDLIVNTGTVTFGNEQTLGNLTLATGGNIVVDKGTVKVTGKLTNAAAADITVKAFSTLELAVNTTTVTETNGAVTTSPLNGKEITNNGTIVFTGKALTFADANAVQTFVGNVQTGNGLIKFADGVTLTTSPVETTGPNAGQISDTNAALLSGVEIDELKTKTVYGVTTGLVGGSFGDVLLGASTTVLNVTGGLTLNGSDGNLVTYNTTTSGNTVANLGDVALGNGASLTTTGAGAKVAKVTNTAGSGALTVASGDLTISGNSVVDTLNIAEGAEVAMAKPTATATAVATLTTTTKLNVAGALTAGDITTADANVLGTVTADKLTATGTVLVGSDDEGASAAGKLIVKDFAGTTGKIFADPAWKDGNQLALGEASQVAIGTITAGTVIAGQGSIVAVGTTDADAAVKAVADAGYTVLGANEGQVKSAVYVEMAPATVNPVTGLANPQTPIAGNIYATGWTSAEYADTSTGASSLTSPMVEVKEGNLMVINMATVGEGSTIFAAATFKNEGTLYLANVNLGDKFNLSATSATLWTLAPGAAQKGEVLFNGDRLMSVVGVAPNGGVTTAAGPLTIDWDAAKLADYDDLETLDLVVAMYDEKAQNGTSKSAQFNSWLMSSTNGLDADGVVQAGNDVASIVGTAGMANVTMDALSQFNDTVAARTSVLAKNGEGVNVWADVNGGKFEGKKVMDGAGYSSDIYAGVLGVDTTVACGAKIGAALTIGTADTDSQNTTAKSSMDSDLFGLSVYTAKQFGDFNVAADIGYMQAANDVNVQAYNLGNFSADSDAFTIGVRGELLAKAGSLDIVPHAGLRYTRLSIDNFEAGYTTDIKNMNVFQMPVGVTVSGELEVAGWNVAPAFDLTFVPTWGDKDIEATLGIGGVSLKEEGAMRVLDSNVVNATLGVSAQNGAWTFGLDYKLGVGSDDRLNNSFNARVNYAF